MYIKLTENKGIEFEFEWFDGEWFNFSLTSRSKQDHAGFLFQLSLFKVFDFRIHFYDGGHWNYDKNRYYNEGEEMEEYNLTKQSEPNLKFLDVKIIAKSKSDKEELINTSKYLHDFCVETNARKWVSLDSDYVGVNYLMHLYTSPELIEVKELDVITDYQNFSGCSDTIPWGC